jgi:hypothetical protein
MQIISGGSMKRIFVGSLTGLVILFALCTSLFASPAQEVASVLDKWTSFHWGDDCFVWIVRYTEDLAEPWADLAVEKGAVSREDRDSYVKSFKAELDMSTREPLLVSITSFSGSPLQLESFGEKIYILDSAGKRTGPDSYDESFDKPVKDNARGLVFFPVQEGPFRVVIKGLGLADGGRFDFPGFEGIQPDSVSSGMDAAQPGRSSTGLTEGVIVISPSERYIEEQENVSVSEPGEKDTEIVTGSLEPSDEPEESGSDGKSSSATGKEKAPENETEERGNLYKSKDLLLKAFLESWISGDYEKMYSLLSESSKKRVSRAVFTRNNMQSPFRIILMNGYTYKWEDDATAVVSSKSELGIMQGLSSKKIKVTREGNGWSVLW